MQTCFFWFMIWNAYFNQSRLWSTFSGSHDEYIIFTAVHYYQRNNVPRLGSVGFVDLWLGYGCLTEFTEVAIVPLQNLQKFRVLWPGRKELTAVSVRYINVVPAPRGIQFMDSNLAQIMEPLIISKSLGIVSNRGHFFLSLPKPRERYDLVAKFLRVC